MVTLELSPSEAATLREILENFHGEGVNRVHAKAGDYAEVFGKLNKAMGERGNTT